MAGKPKYGRILTVRVSAPLERRLRAEARRLHSSASEVARELIEEGLASPRPTQTLAELAGDLLGSVSSKSIPAGRDLRKEMKRFGEEKLAAHLGKRRG